MSQIEVNVLELVLADPDRAVHNLKGLDLLSICSTLKNIPFSVYCQNDSISFTLKIKPFYVYLYNFSEPKPFQQIHLSK